MSNHWNQSQNTSSKLPTVQQTPPQPQCDVFDPDEHMRISYAAKTPHANAFGQYCAEDAIEDFELSDWKNMEKKQPHLVQFAVDHALPVSISDCERSFSSAKFTLNPLRVCMKSDLFEALETLRAWYLQDQEEKDRVNKDIRRKEEQEMICEALGSDD